MSPDRLFTRRFLEAHAPSFISLRRFHRRARDAPETRFAEATASRRTATETLGLGGRMDHKLFGVDHTFRLTAGCSRGRVAVLSLGVPGPLAHRREGREAARPRLP